MILNNFQYQQQCWNKTSHISCIFCGNQQNNILKSPIHKGKKGFICETWLCQDLQGSPSLTCCTNAGGCILNHPNKCLSSSFMQNQMKYAVCSIVLLFVCWFLHSVSATLMQHLWTLLHWFFWLWELVKFFFLRKKCIAACLLIA